MIYPAVLLFLMAGVLAVLVARVLPVFTGVYTGLAGSVAASSYAYITAANIIGWASLCLVIVLTALLLTGAAGGVLRDIFINEIPLIFRKEIYAMACVIGGLVYWICLMLDMESVLAQIIGGVTVFVARILAVKYKITLPILKGDPEP